VRSWKASDVVRFVGCLGAAVPLLLAFSPRADAGLLFDNGAVAGNTVSCDSYADVCLGDGTGWVIYDDFTLGSSATMTGFTYNDFFWMGGPGGYVSTNWWLYNGDPFNGGTLAYSGMSSQAPATQHRAGPRTATGCRDGSRGSPTGITCIPTMATQPSPSRGIPWEPSPSPLPLRFWDSGLPACIWAAGAGRSYLSSHSSGTKPRAARLSSRHKL
jgi:hypothetical protein